MEFKQAVSILNENGLAVKPRFSSKPVKMSIVVIKGWFNTSSSYDRNGTTISNYMTNKVKELKQKYITIANDISYRSTYDSDDAIIAGFYITVPTIEKDNVLKDLSRYEDYFDELTKLDAHDTDDAIPVKQKRLKPGEELYIVNKNISSQVIKIRGINVYGAKYKDVYDRWRREYISMPSEIIICNNTKIPNKIVEKLVSFRIKDSYDAPIKVKKVLPKNVKEIIRNGYTNYLSYFNDTSEMREIILKLAKKYPETFEIGQGGVWNGYNSGNEFRSINIPTDYKYDYINAGIKK